jgi:phage gp29-like protein
VVAQPGLHEVMRPERDQRGRFLSQLRDDDTPGSAVAQLPARAIAKWTPEELDLCLAEADSGNLMRAADLVETITTTDDRASGVLATRTLGMLRLDLSFKGGSEAARIALGGTADAHESGEWWTTHPESEMAQLMSWGIMLGIGVAQRVPLDRELGARQLHRIEAWHPRWAHQNVYSGQWRINHRGGTQDIAAGDGQWILYTPYGTTRPWARGAWRAIAFAWIVKQFALHDRARFSEIFGQPIRVGIAPEGANERSRQRWLSALKNLGRDASVVLPPGYDLKLLSVGGSEGGVGVFDQQIQWADRAIAVVLAGQIVTTEGTPGFNTGSIHESIKADIIGFTAASVATTLHEQDVRPWAALGFGDPNAAPVPQWDTTLPEDQERKAAAMRGAADAIDKLDQVLAPSGRRVDAMKMVERFGIPTVALPSQQSSAPTVQLAPTDWVKVVRVDEARAGAGLPPMGGAEGAQTIDDAVKSKEAARAAAQAARDAQAAAATPTRVLTFSERNAAFLADLAEYRANGLHVDIATLAALHDVPTPDEGMP